MLYTFWVGTGQIHFIDNGDDLQIIIQSQINVSQSLCFDTLRGIDDQQSTFAGRQSARYLIGEIHMARSIDKIEHILLAVFSLVAAAHSLRLDRDTPFTLQVHRVKDLLLHLALR